MTLRENQEYETSIVQFQKNHTHPMEGHQKYLGRGGGDLNVKILEAKYEAKLEFPGGTGDARQKPFMGVYGYFLELHI